MGIFERRKALKPYEYKNLTEYVDAVRHSYWVHTEFNYTSDINDFKITLSDTERELIKRAMLAIAQIEVNVKTFWGSIYSRMPKPEIGAVGFTFAESEVRHMDAYSHLIEILGLNNEFDSIADVPSISKRIDMLNEVIEKSRHSNIGEFVKAMVMFSIFIENVSLFAQFFIMMSYNKHRNLFKGISNAVEATSKEEQLHALFGIDVVNIIRKEYPEYFTEEFAAEIRDAALRVFEAEMEVVEWMFERGETEFVKKETVLAFIKTRLNNSLKLVGFEPVFEVDNKLISETEWFDNEVMTTKHTDFFYKRSINYNKRATSVTAQDLF